MIPSMVQIATHTRSSLYSREYIDNTSKDRNRYLDPAVSHVQRRLTRRMELYTDPGIVGEENKLANVQ